MRYKILINRQVKKKFLSLSRKDRSRIAEKIEFLTVELNHPKLDIKKLMGQNNYRLRVGNWRIIFTKDDIIKIIAIEKLESRGEVYK